MMSPSRAGPTFSTPGVWPGAKSFDTRSTEDEKTRASRRIGMYSANGTGCCLAYCAPGPGCALVDGCQTMPALSRVFGSSGLAMTAPTRIGTPTESTACWISCSGALVRVGVDVARVLRPDHEVRLGDLAAVDVRGEPLGLGDVVLQDLLALVLDVQSDPWDVALDQGDGHLLAFGGRRRDQRGGQGERDADGDAEQCGPEPLADDEVRRLCEEQADRGDDVRDQRRTADRREVQRRGVGLGEGQAPPAEPAVRPPGADGLLGDPDAGAADDRERNGQPEGERQPDGERGEVERFEDGQDQPWHRADIDADPVEQDDHLREPEGDADDCCGTPRQASYGEREDRHGDRRQPPEAVRVEGERENDPAQRAGSGSGPATQAARPCGSHRRPVLAGRRRRGTHANNATAAPRRISTVRRGGRPSGRAGCAGRAATRCARRPGGAQRRRPRAPPSAEGRGCSPTAPRPRR